ncbi:MAG: hypothetical protein ABR552_00085 [Actinomycetota bacterium]
MEESLEERRARRWWLRKARIKRLDQAVAFIEDVGFAMLWPKTGLALPSLWPLGTSGDPEDEFGPEAQRMWGWKDEIPLKKLAWYGPFLRGRKSFLARDLLADLYPREGRPDDFQGAELSKEARRIANIILLDGPTPASVLREASGLGGAAFSKPVQELGRALVITHFGVEEQDSGWPSAMYELTARAFRLPKKRSRARAALRFVNTVIECTARDLRAAFNWPLDETRAALDELADAGKIRRVGKSYGTL